MLLRRSHRERGLGVELDSANRVVRLTPGGQAERDKVLQLDDLTPSDGSNAGRVAVSEVQPDNPSYQSWCRLYALYGDTFKSSRVQTGEKGPDEIGRAHV